VLNRNHRGRRRGMRDFFHMSRQQTAAARCGFVDAADDNEPLCRQRDPERTRRAPSPHVSAESRTTPRACCPRSVSRCRVLRCAPLSPDDPWRSLATGGRCRRNATESPRHPLCRIAGDAVRLLTQDGFAALWRRSNRFDISGPAHILDASTARDHPGRKLRGQGSTTPALPLS